MKFIHIGLTTGNLTSLLHDFIYVKSNKPLSVTGFALNSEQLRQRQLNSPNFSFHSNRSLRIEAKSNVITVIGKDISDHVSLLVIKSEAGKIIVSTDREFLHKQTYDGELMVIAQKDRIRVVLKCTLEEYVRSVLKAEVPANYHLEAIKAQAVSARTYALHPRVNHQHDLCDVCDSHLCCQAFSGCLTTEKTIYMQACSETKDEILVYEDEPILSLFSSCAGGHTENYEDCFSDWTTGLFPPRPLPYLRGVSESIQTTLVNQAVNEMALKRLWCSNGMSMFDSWSPRFRWSVNLSIEDLESTMHHTLSQLLTKKEFTPFISAPSSGVFGSIQSFCIRKRGIGGTAIELIVFTSKGDWQLKKELTIRSLFKNKNANIDRLPSAKIFFDQVIDHRQQLQSLRIHGLGHGHGVGMQQVGAEGMARLNSDYRQILRHYYSGIRIETM